jgi:hypothetical protein
MKTTGKILVVIMVLFTFSSCMLNGIKGNGNVVTDTRSVSEDFDAIHASRGIDVYVTMSNDVSITVKADENLQDIIITEVRDEVLHVYLDKNVWHSSSKKVYVTIPDIKEISTTSGASVISEGRIVAEELKVSATSGSDIKLDVEAEDINCSTTSGADIKLRGKATNLIVDSTSGSDVKAEDLIAEVCDVSVTSGADVDVHVTGTLSARATSGGDIRYIGNPKNISKSESSSGNIHN